MNIALYYPWVALTGGIERTILEVVKRSRHRWTIYTNYYDPAATYPGLAEATVVELARIPTGRDYRSVLQATRTIRRQRVDLTAHDALVICSEGRGDLFALNHRDLPTVCLCFTPLRAFYDQTYRAQHLAGGSGKQVLFLAMEALFKSLTRRAWSCYDRVLCISEEVRQRVIAGGLHPAAGLEVLYPGVDLEACVPTGECDPYFLLPGRIAWTKNLELGIEAFRRFRQDDFGFRISDFGFGAAAPAPSGRQRSDRFPQIRNPKSEIRNPFRLVIAGMADAKSRDYLAKLQELAAHDPAIEFVLSPSDEELQRLYQRCYAVLFTALNEDWGLVPVEAMACAKPVVAVDRGGPRESILPGQTGLLVEPEPEAFADGLRALADAPERAREMGRQGRERARLFSWSHFVDRLDACMEDLHAGTPLPHSPEEDRSRRGRR